MSALSDSTAAKLGLTADDIAGATPMQRNHGNVLYRIRRQGQSSVLKLCAISLEVNAYRLLSAGGVPTIPVHAMADNALLMEDLAVSPIWRLAEAADVEREEVGVAVAGWYQSLHSAGRMIVVRPEGAPAFLTREADALDAGGIMATGERLGLPDLPVWRLAAVHLEMLKVAMRAFPETLNYNDFHWTNLALSREEPRQAIVFDYHLLGIGPPYCDIRNVLGSLGEQARIAFQDAYGPVDDRMAVLNAPLSVLYSLHVASQLPQLPGWAAECVQCVTSGVLEVQLRKAIDRL